MNTAIHAPDWVWTSVGTCAVIWSLVGIGALIVLAFGTEVLSARYTRGDR